MPFVCHATVQDGERTFERGNRVSDADGNRLSADHPGVFTRLDPDPDLDAPMPVAAPDPAPIAPAKSAPPADEVK